MMGRGSAIAGSLIIHAAAVASLAAVKPRNRESWPAEEPPVLISLMAAREGQRPPDTTTDAAAQNVQATSRSLPVARRDRRDGAKAKPIHSKREHAMPTAPEPRPLPVAPSQQLGSLPVAGYPEDARPTAPSERNNEMPRNDIVPDDPVPTGFRRSDDPELVSVAHRKAWIMPDIDWSIPDRSDVIRMSVGVQQDGRVAFVHFISATGDATIDAAIEAAVASTEFTPCVLVTGYTVDCVIKYGAELRVEHLANGVTRFKFCPRLE